MNEKKSYLGTLNAGRERRSGAILDDITEKLDALERRISGERVARNQKPVQARHAELPSRDYRDERPMRGAGTANHDYRDQRQARGGSYCDLARDLDRARERSDEFGSISRISSDLQALREELRQEMGQGIRQEFETLRRQMASIYDDVRSGLSSRELAPELDRISQAVAALSERSGNRDVAALRHEVEDLRETVADLAREETLRTVSNRWDDFDRRWDRIANHIEGGAAASDRADALFGRLSERMEAIYDALEQVPSRGAMSSLEDKVRVLTEAVGQIADAQNRISPDLFRMVEDRLDEISRAIVASSVSAQPVQLDTEPLERIEARISSLANQINEVAARDSSELVAQINALSQRVDSLAQDRDLPSEDLERIAHQLGSITRILAETPPPPDMAVILDGIEQRINALGTTLENKTHDASRQSLSLFKDLEGRLSDLTHKIEAMPRGNGDTIAAAYSQDIEARFHDLTARLDESTRRQSKSEKALLNTLDERLRGFQKELETRQAPQIDTQAIAGIETRLAAISSHLDEASRAIAPEIDASMMETLESRLEEIAGRLYETSRSAREADRSLIENLENQVSDMARFMSNPGPALPELENLAPRLEEIERALAANHDTILQTAQRAAEDALRSAAKTSDAHHETIAGLAADLKALDSLARRTEERSSKTFEAIHETLLKIVDRLAALENPASQSRPAAPQAKAPVQKAAKRAVAEAPSLDMSEDFPEPELEREPARAEAAPAASVSPSQAAAAAAFAALADDEREEQPESDKRPSMLGGLTRALRGKKETTSREPDLDGAPILDDSMDDEPLAPGEGAPDLTAIMNKVRAERDGGQATDPDVAKADFIAAARRAAQAAAAEAEMLKGKATSGGAAKAKSGVGSVLQKNRKPLLMGVGAVLVLLAGLQVGKMVLFNGTDEAPVENTAAISEPAQTEDIQARQVMPTADDSNTAGMASDPSSMDLPADETTDSASTFDATGEQTASTAPDMAADETMATDQAAPEAMASTDTAPEATGASIDFGPADLREAVASGNAKAFFEVGNRYSEGRGIAASPEEATKWYKRSAEAGFAPGQYRYANMLEKGIGTDRDLEGAKTWYQMAAQQGNAGAMHNLAVLFATGVDGVVDNTSAVRWFLDAAEMGVKDSQFNLGILAAKGVGMKQDLIESYKWFAVAARNGDKDAAAKRDEVAKALRPEQLDKARAKADLWKPRTPDAEANTPSIPASWNAAQEQTASVDMTKAVRNIQLILNKNGFDAGTPDGIMGDKTKQAIKAFQTANGMAATGEVDNALISKLLEKK
ncbi:peptidoglycan-binding protein [Zhengella mangrovi]|nr:peptidoglycan-binding protein [Zhengella mangrovi]